MDPQNPFANLSEETQKKIQEMQILEQTFQQFMMQKQAFTMEASESEKALEELKKAEGEVFKIVGNSIVIKTEKQKLQKEIEHKKELVDLRLKNIETQEKEFTDKLQKLREEVMKEISEKQEPEEKEKKEQIIDIKSQKSLNTKRVKFNYGF